MQLPRGRPTPPSASTVGALPSWLRNSGPWSSFRRNWYSSLAATSPAAYCAWNRRFAERHVVDRNTQLVVEGYPGAAQSAVRETLAIAAPHLRVASHLHSHAHLRRAIDLGVPVLFLLRPPLESVASLLVRFPDAGFEPRRELRRYAELYEATGALADQLSMSRFDDTTSHLAGVLASIEQRSGVGLGPGGRTLGFTDARLAPMVERAWSVLDAFSATTHPSFPSAATARPSPERKVLLRGSMEAVRAVDPPLLATCRRLHEDLVGRAASEIVGLRRGRDTALSARMATRRT